MKKCPYCAHENGDDAVVCLICHTELTPPSAPDVDPRLTDPGFSLVTVATFKSVEDAGMLKARLEGAGIEACIPEEFSAHLFWTMTPNPIECVTVRVAAKDYEAARQLLGEGERR
ncbi:MAG TPA: DUF2007 domain-containing protein [Verrucomicrobiae bacterium]|nr:DUF2007 domain-containing protein [Verrucomicrobiae bacterium]